MNEITEQLALAGDALQRAWQKDHAQRVRSAPRRKRVAVGTAIAALVIGVGAAIADTLLKSPVEEATGMIEGYGLFAGSDPTCVSQTAMSFHCDLAKSPIGEAFYNADGSQALDVFLGMKAETVDRTKHVDGACVSVTRDGRSWDCYLGEAAVNRGLLRRSYLGTYLPRPPTA